MSDRPVMKNAVPCSPRARLTFVVYALLLSTTACAASPPAAPASVAAAAPTRESPPAAPLDGPWHGTLGGQLHLVVTLTARGGNRYEGILKSIDQNATLPIDTIDVNDATVRFEIKRVGGVFEGTLDRDRSQMKGTWTQRDVPQQPLVLARGPGDEKAFTEKPPSRPLDAPIDVVVPFAPSPFRADDKNHLVYELHVTNLSSREITLRRIDAVDAVEKHALLQLEAGELAARIVHPGMPAVNGDARLAVGPGTRAVVFVWIDLAADAPKAIEHRITVAVKDEPTEMSTVTPRVVITSDAVPLLAAPLREGDWVAGNGPSNASHHRCAFLPVGGRARISQRFAIDWVRVKEGDKTFAGSPSDNKSYFAYGAEALAVADGVVTETKDRIPENVPGNDRAQPISLETIAGNHVIVDIGHGRFAFYAHLQPGSLRVKVGDRVRRGQVLGLVGNSGNSTEPHLHFHVSDASSPLGSEGVPYAFESFEMRAPNGTEFKTYVHQLPTELEVVRFSSGARAK